MKLSRMISASCAAVAMASLAISVATASDLSGGAVQVSAGDVTVLMGDPCPSACSGVNGHHPKCDYATGKQCVDTMTEVEETQIEEAVAAGEATTATPAQ